MHRHLADDSSPLPPTAVRLITISTSGPFRNYHKDNGIGAVEPRVRWRTVGGEARMVGSLCVTGGSLGVATVGVGK
jgi:hypothetical protein